MSRRKCEGTLGDKPCPNDAESIRAVGGRWLCTFHRAFARAEHNDKLDALPEMVADFAAATQEALASADAIVVAHAEAINQHAGEINRLAAQVGMLTTQVQRLLAAQEDA